MDAAEYDLMDRVEGSMWWYRAVHANIEALLARFLPRADGALLDAGCGTGGMLKRVAERFPAVRAFGLDFDRGAAARAAGKSRAAVVAGTVNALPFADGSFDALLSIDVLCHRSVDLKAALGEVVRCLKPGGVFVVNLPAFEWLRSDHDERVHTAHRFQRRETVDLLQAAGLTVRSARYWNTLPFPLMVLRRKVFRPKDAASDVQDYAPAVNRAFGWIMATERALAATGLPFPFGGSVLAAAVKPHG